jgi:hypothetical protein
MDFFKCSGWRKSMAITDPVVTEKRARGTAAASFAFNGERAGETATEVGAKLNRSRRTP